MGEARAVGAGLLGEPHHDGSGLCVLERPTDFGDDVTVRLRVPRARPADRVLLRYDRDGEPRNVEAVVDEETETDTWWRATFPAWNPATRYRWLLSGGEAGFAWLNGLGRKGHDVTDADDFVVTLDPGGPDWHLDAVVYEIFPDRFARGGGGRDTPGWAVPRPWDALPTGRGRATPVELYGGDFAGVEARLDHVERLGANTLYFTPFFPARSSHRYDATTFDRVDPLLGGDEALASLVRAAHGRGMRVLGDLTLNHTGDAHEWFTAALSSPDAPERELYYFDGSPPKGYESWLGHPSLPKLAWEPEETRRRMGAVLRRYLAPPFDLDGWRIDVANMVGRYRALDVNREVSQWARAQVGDKLIVAEHGHDFRPALAAHGWHGVMNYAGFLRPVWTWLLADDPPDELRRMFWGIPVPVPRLGGAEAVAAMQAYRAGVPWDTVAHSWLLLDSHDTGRFRTVTGSRALHVVGLGLQMTTPGVPMVFAGDEVGLEGEWGEDARRTIPWDDEASWDGELLAAYRRLIGLRRRHEALRRGGIRYAHVGDDAVAYLREAPGERLLCLAARADHAPVALPLAALGAEGLETLEGEDAEVDGGVAVLPSGGPAFHVWRLR